MFSIREAIILAGGLGTRLRPVVSDVPKSMAPVNGQPFLSCLMNYLSGQGIERVILATGYKHDTIAAYFGQQYRNMRVDYSRETRPLGTGGALRKALEIAAGDWVFLCNGDTFFEIDLADMARQHIDAQGQVTLALKWLERAGRYGLVQHCGHHIVAFLEKQSDTPGLINGGLYCINKNLFRNFQLPQQFSLETDFLTKYCHELNLQAYIASGYFLDIGVPEDYARAQQELKSHFDEGVILGSGRGH